MSGELKLHQPAPSPGGPEHAIPAIIADAGEEAASRFVEFFTANIRNPNTRRAYARAVAQFLRWCEARGLTPPDHRAHRRRRLRRGAQQTARDPLGQAAPRRHPDALRLARHRPGRRRSTPPARSAGPKHVVKKGKTPVLSAEDEARDAPREHRRARPSSASGTGPSSPSWSTASPASGPRSAMKVEDYYPQGKRWWLRLHEKGGKHHEMPAHHNAEEYLDAYVEAAGIAEDQKKGPLFRTARSARRSSSPTKRAAPARRPWRWSSGGRRRRASATAICCHTLPGHRHHRTTWRTAGRSRRPSRWPPTSRRRRPSSTTGRATQITLDEVERIAI